MKLDWRQGILYLTVMGMEGCALYMLLAVFNQQVAGGHLATVTLLLLYPLAFVINKMLRWLRLRTIFRYLIDAFAWAIALLLMAKVQLISQMGLFDTAWLAALNQSFWHGGRPELIIFFGSILLWFVGRRLAGIRVDFATAVGEFQFSLAVLLIILFATSQLDITIAGSISVIIAFALSSLLAMSLAHAREGSGWLTGLNQGHWLGLLLASIGLVLVLGLLLSAALTPDFMQVVIDALKWVWNRILAAVFYLMSLLPTPSGGKLPELPPPDVSGDEQVGNAVRELIPEALRTPLRIGWVILASGALLAALWRISTQIAEWLRRRLATSGGEVEPLKGAFGADMINFLKRIMARLFGFLRLTQRQKTAPAEVHPVRQIYRQFLKWAAKHGFPRPAFQTPYEYLATLEELLPASANQLSFITEQYVNTRYGLITPSEEDMDRLRQTWQQVKQGGLKPPAREA